MVEHHVSYWDEATSERVNVTRFNATNTGQILWDENARSVNYRYKENDPAPRYSFTFRLSFTPPVQIIKAAHCLDYQSCETDDWETTLAYKILQTIISAACHNLPGYDDAYWGIKAGGETNMTQQYHEGQEVEVTVSKSPWIGSIWRKAKIVIHWMASYEPETYGVEFPTVPVPSSTRSISSPQ
jgi:hypothetical protein